MLVEFKIDLTNDGLVTVTPTTTANQNPGPQAAGRTLGATFDPKAQPNPAPKGGAGPIDGLGTGAPISGSTAASGSPATVLVLGPIVICGSGPGHGHSGTGGAGPIDGLGTGLPANGNAKPADSNGKNAVRKGEAANLPRRRTKRA